MTIVMNANLATASPGVSLQFTPTALDVRTDLVLDVGRRRVFDALLHIAAWWPDHGRAGSRVVFEPRVGGLFYENCDDGCGVLLGQVSRLLMPDAFAIEGSFGLDVPICGLWSVQLDAVDANRSVLHGRYQAFGAIDDALRAQTILAWELRYSALAHSLAG
jgi:hypothetical protein